MKFPGNREVPRANDGAVEAGGYEIVELTASDWQEVKELRLQGLKNAPKAFGETLEEARSRGEGEWKERFNKGRYFGARRDGKLVGMLCLVRDNGEKVRHTASVYSVYVSEEAQGLGIGKALFQRVKDEARALGLRKLRLRVGAENAPARHLYEKMGFKQTGTAKDELFVDGEYVDAVEMELMLTDEQ